MKQRLPLNARVADRLRAIADRIDRDGAPKGVSFSFTFERGVGIKLRDDGRGCPLWHLRDTDYSRAFTEADAPVKRIDWTKMRYYTDGELNR